MEKKSKSSKYDHLKIEKKWQVKWAKDKIYTTNPSVNSGQEKRPKAFVLDMFPYPSGEGLHVGHPKGYIATDIYSRFKRMNGFNVLHPMGWDAFGLPAENYAIKNKINPEIAVKKNIKYFKSQLEKIGFDYDWSREINTTDPKYYKWTQWIFLQMFKKGLAYESYEPINWCPSCKTGLANEDLENGKCERCGSEVEKKPLRQWVLKITDYADRLLKDLDDLNWPESIKESQRNWIGRSEGSEISFPVKTKYKYVILHGWKSNSKRCFIPWLKEELEAQGHEVITLDLPHPFIPDVIEQAEYVLNKVKFDENTIIIAHSLGSVVSYRILERLKKPIRKLVLVGGLIEPRFRDKERLAAKYLMSWKFETEKIKKNVSEIVILEDDNDVIIPDGESKIIQQTIGGETWRVKADKPHFCGNVEPIVLEHCLDQIKVFTTRADTLFGATYLVLAPEHSLIEKMADQITNIKEVRKYIAKAIKHSEIERTAEGKEKTGIKLEGLNAINPANKEEVPIFVADYVLPDYGTGAIMAVPAHDTRDWQFAKKFNLPIKTVIHQTHTAKTLFIIESLESNWEKEFEEIGVKMEAWEDWGVILRFPPDLTDKITKIGQKLLKEGPWYFEINGPKNLIVFKGKTFDLNKKENNEQAKKHARLLNIPETQIDWDQSPNPEMFTDKGVLIHSGDFSGLSSEKAIPAITKMVRGKLVVKYKLRDWVFSRQRYWGEPIPIIHCPKCGNVPVPEKDLPVVLPKVKSYEPTGTGESPLASIAKWVNVKCPLCGEKAKRETNTMPQWAGSSWYYLRYIDPKNSKALIDKKKDAYWSPVDMYVGGTEHATRHLIYARFWHKFLQDIGVVNYPEPFKQLKNQGMILGSDNRKMSKRWGNVVNPDQVVHDFGADTLRIYEMFMGPFSQGAAWSTDNLIGSRRFIDKIWRLKEKVIEKKDGYDILLNKTIKQITEDINNFDYNTAISAMMILTNDWEKRDSIKKVDWLAFLKLLAPFAPHLAEELWHLLGEKKSIHLSSWPNYDKDKLQSETITLVIQVNGKTRETISAPANLSEAEALKMALNNDKIAKWLDGQEPKKVIYIANRLLNLVI